VWVAAHVLDTRSTDDAIGPGRERQVVDGGDHAHRDAEPLDFFGDRCAATIAGASRRHQEAAIDAALP
jgi:hypothetical protein